MMTKERSTEIKGDAEFNYSHDVSNFLLSQKREIEGRRFSSKSSDWRWNCRSSVNRLIPPIATNWLPPFTEPTTSRTQGCA
jgi:hypothetical protein